MSIPSWSAPGVTLDLLDGRPTAVRETELVTLHDEAAASDDDALVSVLAHAAPEIAADWPVPRDLDTLLQGVAERHENVSGAWAWVAEQPVARPYAAELFEAVEIAAAPMFLEPPL